ncbi:hypothetical protein IAU60_004614 [Kwoniella sp. DSM 27419]
MSDHTTYHPHFPSARASSSTTPSRLPHPPSKLSPPLASGTGSSSATDQTGMKQEADSSTPDPKRKKEEKDMPKRGYRACVHCRMRKARCDLGDVNAPSEPPCSRCRREQRECVFLPSKRRRRTSGAGDQEVPNDAAKAPFIPSHEIGSLSTAQPANQAQPQSGDGQRGQQGWTMPPPPTTYPNQPESQGVSQTSQWPADILSAFADSRNSYHSQLNSSHLFPPAQPTPSTVQPHQQGHQGQAQQSQQHDTTTPGSLGESSVTSASGHSPGHRTKRRRSEPEGTRKIVNASLSNEMDALEILANAATDGNSDESEGGEGRKSKMASNGDAKKVSWDLEEEMPPARELRDFHLIKLGIVDETGLQDLVSHFFRNHHPSLPIFQTARIPRTREQLIDLAFEDSFLLTCIIAIASHHPPDPRYREVHDKTWPILRETMADYSFAGLPASIGFVEGVLLLAEHLPRDKSRQDKESSLSLLAAPGSPVAGEHGTDNRRSWSLTGLAIRAAYLIGLDQIALEINEGHRDPDMSSLAFWSRGPSLCFVGYSHISQTGSAAARVNFPLQLSPGETSDESTHDDSASLMQALVELTQIMTNAHDILYPSKARTAILVRQGEYFLFLDHFRRALDSYRSVWKGKKWSNPSIHELSWMTFQFVRLYISSFGYSAHVKRAQWRAEEEPTVGKDGIRQPVQLFPRGSATSPDAIYIYESIGAANEIMNISLRLAQMGSLRYLPSRYLINISYAAVFALKSSYSGAVTGKDMLRIRELVDHICAALVLACPDKDHPAVRYGHMLRMLSKKLEQLSDASAVPSRFPSPEPFSDNAPQPGVNAQQTPLPWTLPTDSLDPPSFQMPSFTDLSPIPASFNYNTGSSMPGIGTNTGNEPTGLGIGVQQAPGTTAGIPGASGLGTTAGPGHDGLFDFEGNMDFDLKGFWDDFALGENAGFPFR